jgi:hypothetical protein
MPPANQFVQQASSHTRLRSLIYGRDKCRKTTWACLAAKAGFNVTLLCGDPEGATVLSSSQFDKETLSRINVIDISNTRDRNVMHQFAIQLFSKGTFLYNEDTKLSTPGTMGFKAGQSYWKIDLDALNANDLIIWDSHSSYVDTLLSKYAADNNMSLAAAEKTEWDGWGWMGRAATWFITNFVQLPCHLVLIAHAQEYEKRKGNEILWTRTQPKSTSGPHAQTITKDFSDVLFFKQVGSDIRIDAASSPNRMCGSRALEPKEFTWKDMQYGELAKCYGVSPDHSLPCEAFTFHTFDGGSVTKSKTQSPNILTQPKKPVLSTPLKS